MKVALYMATTANGKIATEEDEVPFVSESHFQRYSNRVNETGCVIVGRRTYEEMPEEEFEPDCRYVVMSGEEPENRKTEDIEFTDEPPQDVIERLESDGLESVLLAGGSITNSAFMEKDLVDEILLDIMPEVIGNGIPLFDEANFEAGLELLDVKEISGDEVQLRYKVVD